MQNLLDPAILFFVFGCFAGLIRSNLEIPRSIAKFLSLYLLMALGLKGGFALAKTGLNPEIALSLMIALAMAFIVPIIGYWFLKDRIAKFDAAAVAAAAGTGCEALMDRCNAAGTAGALETYHRPPVTAHKAQAMLTLMTGGLCQGSLAACASCLADVARGSSRTCPAQHAALGSTQQRRQPCTQ